MAETLPLPGFDKIGIRIVSGIAQRRDRGGTLITRRRNMPFWAGPITSDKLFPRDRADYVAFLDNCVSRNLRIDFVHPRFQTPAAYTLATWPLVVDPTLASVTHGHQIVVAGLQLGMQLKRGDRLTLVQGELRCCRPLSADLVVASTTAQALPLSARIPLGVFTAGALVRFRLPPIRLAVVADSYQDEEVYAPTPITAEFEEALA